MASPEFRFSQGPAMDMTLVETIAHQLDMGAQFLSTRDPIRARLALILTDNAIELLLYAHADDGFRACRNSKVDEASLKRLNEALGERFDPKVKYARSVGLIDDDAAQFIREAHKFRCQAYHTGRIHDAILWELAHAYHDVACNALSRARAHGFLMHLEQEYPTIAGCISKEPLPGLTSQQFVQLSTSLAARKPRATESLAATLRCCLLERCARIREGVSTLFRIGESVSGFRCMDDLLFKLQREDKFYSYAPGGTFAVTCTDDGACEVDPSQKERLARAAEAVRNWKPDVTQKTLLAWEEQTRRLNDKLPSGRALQMYWTLSSKLQPFQRIVERNLGLIICD
jgi:hypothetical protein